MLLLIIAIALGLYLGGRTIYAGPEPEPAGGPQCTEGQIKACSLGNCSGTSLCVGGSWGGCRWERICPPGSRLPCINNSCVYALKECNECGTGYGPCIKGNAS